MSGIAQAAIGTLFQIGDGASPENFTTVGRVGDITGPSFSRIAIDTTDQSDTWTKAIPGLKSLGQITFTVFFDPADPTQNNTSPEGLVYVFINSTTAWNFKILWPTSPVHGWKFSASVDKLEFKQALKGAIEMMVTLTGSGVPTYV